MWGGSFALLAGMTREGKQSPIIAIAILLILIGVFAFLAVVLRLL
jgi:putative membrane protein